ncbi:MAG TPA: putative LPS assembly protein LptD [Gemmatimonadaceae bacterium]|nr:putative LPS assembly protein LptD [Gemmatimonadaceae bacterium]
MRSAGRRALVLLTLVALLPASTSAQGKPVPRGDIRPGAARPMMRGRPGANAPAQRTDTSKADTTAQWSEPDSVMAALLQKPGYTVTRYEGDVVTFDALTKAFAIAAATARKAQVEREGQRVVTDSNIVYADKTRTVNVSGNFHIVPGEGQAPIAGAGNANYNLSERSGRLTNATVTVEESGASWFIRSEIGKTALGDSTKRIPARFYGLGGSLTSCDDSIPDYHFQLREIKRTEKTLVARPAVLYIRDIPVMWLPFVFQDIRPGRRSGVLPMRVGVSDIVRNNPGYKRHIENIGYYWAFSDYMDAAAWVDWRSAAGADSTDPGFYTFNWESKYNWMSRFVNGRFATAYTNRRDGFTNLAVSWEHGQQFNRNRRLQVSGNYVTSTRLQRQLTLNPYQAVATIRSQFSYSDKIGPASLSLGGNRVQYPGRLQVDQQIPTLSITTAPLAAGSWLTWTPSFRFTENDNLHIDQPGTFSSRFIPGTNGQLIDTVGIKRNRFYREISFGSPIRIFGFDLQNNTLTIRDALNDFPEEKVIYPGADSSRKTTRVFRRTYRTDIDWNPMFSLPSLASNRFKITPTIALQNVDPNPFWVRTEQSNGDFVHQTKRLTYGISAAPTLFGIWPGFGPFSRLRHSISPTISYSFAPSARVNTEYLEATGQRLQGYLGALRQSAISFGLSQNIEAKIRRADTTDAATSGGDSGNKIKLLSMQFSPLSYDFERARFTGRKLAGLTTENVSTRVTSDLLPGFDLGVDYSLFQGSTMSDTAVFKPFLTRVTSSFRISQRENPLAVITRLFGQAVPERRPDADAGAPGPSPEDALARQYASQPVAGQSARMSQFVTTPTHGWDAQISFTTTRTRPPSGSRVINFDPRDRCEQFREVNPFAYDVCVNAPINDQPIPSTTAGAPYVLLPPQTSLSGSTNFELTQKWSAAWQTSYDFERHEFASHIVSLQRDLHDFRAVFAFTHSPNGNFAFNFFIALKPQPELKFDYSRATIRNQ